MQNQLARYYFAPQIWFECEKSRLVSIEDGYFYVVNQELHKIFAVGKVHGWNGKKTNKGCGMSHGFIDMYNIKLNFSRRIINMIQENYSVLESVFDDLFNG